MTTSASPPRASNAFTSSMKESPRGSAGRTVAPVHTSPHVVRPKSDSASPVARSQSPSLALVPVTPGRDGREGSMSWASPERSQMALVRHGLSPHRARSTEQVAAPGHWDDPTGAYLHESMIEEAAPDPLPLHGKGKAKQTSVARSWRSNSTMRSDGGSPFASNAMIQDRSPSQGNPHDHSMSTVGGSVRRIRDTSSPEGVHIEWADRRPVSWMGDQSEHVQEACAKAPRHQRMERARIAADAARTVDEVIGLLRGESTITSGAESVSDTPEVHEPTPGEPEPTQPPREPTPDPTPDGLSDDDDEDLPEEDPVLPPPELHEDLGQVAQFPTIASLRDEMRRLLADPPVARHVGRLNAAWAEYKKREAGRNAATAQLREKLATLREKHGDDHDAVRAMAKELLERETEAFEESLAVLSLYGEEERVLWWALASGEEDPYGNLAVRVTAVSAVVNARTPGTALKLFEAFRTRVEALPLDEAAKEEALLTGTKRMHECNAEWISGLEAELRRLDETAALSDDVVAERRAVLERRLAAAREEQQQLPSLPEEPEEEEAPPAVIEEAEEEEAEETVEVPRALLEEEETREAEEPVAEAAPEPVQEAPPAEEKKEEPAPPQKQKARGCCA